MKSGYTITRIKTSWCQQLPAKALRGSCVWGFVIVWERGTGERVLISAVSHWEEGRLQPNPEKRNTFITEQHMKATGELPLFHCQWMDGVHKRGYVSCSTLAWTLARVHWNGCISICSHTYCTQIFTHPQSAFFSPRLFLFTAEITMT